MPGYSTRSTAAPKVILHAVEDVQNLYLPGGVYLDGTSRYQGETVVPAGTPLIRDSVSGRHKPWVGTQANGAGAAITTLVVDDAGMFQVGDAIYVGGTPTTVDAVDYATNTITLAGAATWSDNSLVTQSSTYVADNPVVGFISDEFGVDVQPNGEDEDVPARMLIRGRLKLASIVGGEAAAASKAAGNQPLLDDVQFWSGDGRLA